MDAQAVPLILDIIYFTNQIINTNNPIYIYKFARDIKEANIKLLEEGIIKTEDYYMIYRFAINIKEANKEKLLKIYNNYLKNTNKNRKLIKSK